MSLLVVGLSHHTAPVDVLERTAVSPEALAKSLEVLGRDEHLAEVVVLSTCNRTEIYAHATRFHRSVDEVLAFLAEHSGVDTETLRTHTYRHYDDAAVAHLFGVTSGIDSMIVGESEILGQVRDAWRTATFVGAAGPLLDPTFRHAIEVGRRARSETALARGASSVSSAAVELARERLGSLDGRRSLLVGAGAVAEGMLAALIRAADGNGLASLTVANRDLDRGEHLAARAGGSAIALDDRAALAGALADADLVMTSTGADEILITRDDVEEAMRGRERPLLIVDVAVPRDVDPGVDQVFGVMRCDIDDLRTRTDATMAARLDEVDQVRTIINAELDRFRTERLHRQAVPIIRALRGRTDELRAGELARNRARIEALGPDATALVDEITRGLVNTVLHEPTVRLKDAAGTTTGELLAESLAALFDLDVDVAPTDDVPDPPTSRDD